MIAPARHVDIEGTHDTRTIADDDALTDDRIGAIRRRPLEATADKGTPAASHAPLLEARRETMLVALAAMDDELVATARGATQLSLQGN